MKKLCRCSQVAQLPGVFAMNKNPHPDNSTPNNSWMQSRFRGFLPVVVDLETGGFNEKTDAILELAAIIIGVDKNKKLFAEHTIHFHVEPFDNANIEESALKINNIKPYHPLRLAQSEIKVLNDLFAEIKKALSHYGCSRAILVGHNAFFDLKFLNEAIKRNKIKNNPFHQFSSLDTVTLGALAYRQTVLAKIADVAGIKWDIDSAHSALYDTQVTAQIFCKIFNTYDLLSSDDT